MGMNNVNKVIMVANLGHDPELRYTSTGGAFLPLSVATSRAVKVGENEWRNEPCWHRVVVWGKRAETCAKYLKRGNRVYLEGILQPSRWKDKDGVTHRTSDIMVEDIKFLGGRSREEGDAVSTEVVPAMAAPEVDTAYTVSVMQ